MNNPKMALSRLASLQRLATYAALPALVAGSASIGRAQSRETIRVLGLPLDDTKSVYYGIRAGIFRKYGLDVNLQLVASGPAATAALIGGSADVVETNIVTVLQANERGVPMRIIAGGALYLSDHPNSMLLTAKDGPIHSAADLNGKVVGTVSLGGILLVSTRAWIDQHGGDSRTVKFIESPTSSMVSMIDQGRLAAVTSNEPAASQALATGRVRDIGRPMDSIGERYESAGFAVMEPAVLQDPNKFGRFAKVMYEAQVYTNAHQAETVDLVASYTGTSPDIVAHSVRAIDTEYVDERNIQPIIDVLAKYGTLKRRFLAADVISSAALRRPN